MTQEEAKYILEHTVISWSVSGSDAREAIRMAIKELKRKKGKWIKISITDDGYAINYRCSCCKGDDVKYPWKYCPNCGAEMRGESNENDNGSLGI